MAVITDLLGMIFGGGGRNVVKETAEVYRVNAEAQAGREVEYSQAALAQFAAEFAHPRKGWFDRFVDGLNRLPRPFMALGIIALLVAAMMDPIWFSERMQGISLVPEPVWWLVGVIVSFYFGGRHQAKTQEFQKSIAKTVAMTPSVVANVSSLRALDAGANDTEQPEFNPALADWRKESSKT